MEYGKVGMNREKHIYDENNGLTYSLYGDYYLPDLAVPEEETANYGKYGMLRKNYLKEHKQWYYQSMVLSGKLNEHLNMVDKEAHEMVELLIKQMAVQQGITEQLKADAPIVWVQKMNALKSTAEEIVLYEIVYVMSH